MEEQGQSEIKKKRLSWCLISVKCCIVLKEKKKSEEAAAATASHGNGWLEVGPGNKTSNLQLVC